MNTKKIIPLILLLLSALSVYSQRQDPVTQTLDQFGKQKGSVLVQLSQDVLSQGSNLTLYKSLIIDNIEDDKRRQVIDSLSASLHRWLPLSEIRKKGTIESGSYYIASPSHKGVQYLLVKNSKKQLTVVYIQGDFAPGQLQAELKKLKDLFIYINNKRIKIG